MSVPASEPSAALLAARLLLDEFVRGGGARVCIAPGSRSTPLALAASERGDLATHVHVDERSMGFFALGLARAGRRPVAVVCTSGTAAANLLPAVVEAFLGGGALVLLTADRPPEQRGIATPQTIEQVGLFGAHVRWSCDVPILPGAGEHDARALRSIGARAIDAATSAGGGPVHLNMPIREPFVDDSYPPARTTGAGAPASGVDSRDDRTPFTRVHGRVALDGAEIAELATRMSRAERGVIVAAGGKVPAADVAALAAALDWPVLADPLSGLRFGSHDRSRVADTVEPLLQHAGLRRELAPDAVLRLGGTPPPRSVQTWLDESGAPLHIVIAERHWPDPFHAASDIVRSEAAAFCRALAGAAAPVRTGQSAWTKRWLDLSHDARRTMEAELSAPTELFDGVVMRAVADALPSGSTLFVGNSMPVRDAETFLGSRDDGLRVLANRGASGIDGVLSTALGVAAAGPGPTALVLGDLSFLHDATALLLAAREGIPLLVVVVNNDGGGIFSLLPLQQALADVPGGKETFERCFTTPHGADLARLAGASGVPTFRAGAAGDLPAAIREGLEAAARGPAVVEVHVDREAGLQARARVLAAVQDAVLAATTGAVATTAAPPTGTGRKSA